MIYDELDDLHETGHLNFWVLASKIGIEGLSGRIIRDVDTLHELLSLFLERAEDLQALWLRLLLDCMVIVQLIVEDEWVDFSIFDANLIIKVNYHAMADLGPIQVFASFLRSEMTSDQTIEEL